MKIVAQMDEISSINIYEDSTFAILLEAQNRGHEIFYYLPKDMAFEDNVVKAKVYKINLAKEENNHVKKISAKFEDLTNFDLILVRQDPPFDMNYITNTYLLEKIKDKVLIMNNPSEIRNCPEKIFVTDFAKFIPPTLITSNLEQIKEFRKKHGEIIIKPLYGAGGDGVFYLQENDKNINILSDVMDRLYKSPLVVQKFIKEVKNGDKRILFLNGEVLGAVNRMSSKEDIRSNFHAGGKAKKAQISDREKIICAEIGKELKKRQLFFVGIDIIGDYVTEINVTSPTGINEINRLNNDKIETKIVEFFEGYK